MNVDLMNNMSNNEKTNKTNPKLDVKATSYCIKSQVIGPSHELLNGGGPTKCTILRRRCLRPYKMIGWLGEQKT